METLRKLSSMGRSKESKEGARAAVENASNGGGPNTEEIEKKLVVVPSPPRARVTLDADDEVEEVTLDADDEVEEVEDAGDDDSYDSAVEKMGTSTTANVVEEVQVPKDAEAPKVSVPEVEQGDESEKDGETETGNGVAPGESFSNSVDEESSSSSPDVEDEENLTRQVSVRAMPVAKLSTENEEQEEDVEEDDEEEVDNEDEYEEANDEVLGEEEDAASAAVGGVDEGTLSRIIARESEESDYDLAMKEESITSPAVEEEVEEAASTPLPDQEEESVVSEGTETREPGSPSPVAEEETAAKEVDDIQAVVPLAEAEVGAVLKEEDSSNVEEKSDEADTSSPEEGAGAEEKQEEEEAVPQAVETELPQAVETEQPHAVETELAQAVTSAAEPEFDVTRVKDEVAPEVVPLATAEVGNVVKESEVEETDQAATPPKMTVESRGASSSLQEELQKFSESRSLREQSSSEEVKSAVDTESAPAEKEEESTVSEPVTTTESKYVVKRAASIDLEAELKKMADARLEKEASDRAASVSTETIEATVSEPSVEKEEDTSAPEEVVVEQKVIEAGEGVTDETLDELKELTYEFHMQGRPESDASEVQSALATASDSAEQESTDSTSSTTAVAEKLSPEVAEVRILEEAKVEEPDSTISKEELSNEVVGDSGVVPSPANLYTALKAVDDDLPALKSENGNVAETENVQSKPRGFSAVDFTGEDGDSDADAEDVDEENDDDDDDDDDDEDETDMDTAKALAELANAVGKSGSDSGNKPSMGAAGPSLPSLPQRPAARKTAAATALDTAGRITTRPTAAPSTQLTTTTDENANGETAEGNETREKLQNIRVKFLRLAHRLGQSPQNVVVAQVLYRLGLAESLRGGSAPNRTGAFSFDRANALAEEQEAANQEEELDFACTILVLGKTGVGKSATINSIFDDRKSVTSAFKPSTNKVQEIVGTVHGIKVRVIDTPGLLPSVADQQHNERIMGQVKKHIKKQSPDIVLYFDRLDMQSRDYGDLPLLRTITDLFGAAVWFNAIVVLTHASSAPPDGPNGVPLSYEMFVAQRSHVVQQTIRQAAGDMRLMNPVSLVENHPACRTNRSGQRVLPNGQIWKPQLLLLCFASKILAEANSLLKLQETATPGRPFGQRSRVPPLPFLLSSLLQSRAQLKLPDEQLGESDESDDEEEEEDSDADDYDELPPFRSLSKEELEELSKEQRQDYMDELADRERLFQKKQYREEMRRRKEMKKRAAQMSKEELAQPGDDADDEAGKAAAVPVPMPDMALPPSFDSDNPTHRYRYLETANQWLVRPVLETHGWDHDAGYDGFNVEKMFVVKDKIPVSISGQVTKDKKEAQVNFEAAASLKHGEGKVTLTGFDIQTIGKDLAYTLRAETRFNNFRRNKTTAGVTCTVLNDTIAAGVKLEDRILIGKRIKMVVNGGVLTGKGDKAFGGSLEATLRGKEYPLSRTLSTLGLSVMDWHGDLAIGGNLQSQFMVGKTMMVGRANLNNRGSGQVSIRASSSEQLQMVLIGIVPILRSLINCRFGFGGQPSQ